MTQINKFSLNTHFTALKQLPQVFTGSLHIPGRTVPANSLGIVLGRTILNVPAGVYVETPLLRCTLDSNINHLRHGVMLALGTQGYFYYSINQINNSQYELIAKMENYSISPLVLSDVDIEVFLRLAIAPFDAN